MKKNIFLFVLCGVLSGLTACATSSANNPEPPEKPASPENIENPENTTDLSDENTTENPSSKTEENIQEEDNGPLFIDWKYKGFGYELPDWFEPLWNNDLETLKTILPEVDQILTENGDDVDICETILDEKQKNCDLGEADYSIWVKVNLKNQYFKEKKDYTESLNNHTYFDYRLYLKKTNEE